MNEESLNESGWQKYLSSMRYMLYLIFRPFDGFWDLVHEKRGSIAAATTYLILFLMVRMGQLMFTNFQFINAPIQYINLFEQCASLLIPFIILCVANWSLTTLFDGKGRLSDIYMAMCYALAPMILIQLPLIFLSHVLAVDEKSVYNVLASVSILWSAFLAFVGLMQVHDYGPGKTILFLIATLFGAMVIIFLMLVFLSLISDALGYFVSIVRELMYRLY